MSTSLLAVQEIVVSFDGFRVLDHLSIDIAPGELRFLIGPNGAGKTTLMDVISGKVRAESGAVLFDVDTLSKSAQRSDMEAMAAGASPSDPTVDLTRLTEDQIVRRGIGRKFQTPSVFGSLTCYENVEVASGFRDRLLSFFLPVKRERKERLMWALERVGLEGRRDMPASALSHGERQWLEIGMLLVQDPKLLLLDEPVAGMTGRERERTGELLHALEGRHSLIVTEHDMEFVRQFARTVTVLHMGKVLREGDVETIHADPEVQEVYTGRQKLAAGAAS